MYLLAHAVSPEATTPTQPDYIALAMVAVMALVVVIMVIRKRAELQKKAAQTNNAEVTVNAPVVKKEAAPAPGSAGPVKIYDVEPKTAAMVMAIVAEKTGKPLNELRFISIKEVK